MVLVFKKKKVLALGLVFLVAVLFVASCFAVKAVSTPKAVATICIDAGHGGVDGGAEGATGVSESYLNLQYAKTLQKISEGFGWSVVMTRSDMNGLYSPLASNKKRSEMEKRKNIIQNSGADVVVSIHMNSFPFSLARGAQVYHAEGSESGQALAECVQNSLHSQIPYAKQTAKVGDFFVLNCSDSPSILVECGFLSNAEEEELLLDEEYMQKFCYNLFCGLLSYFSFS